MNIFDKTIEKIFEALKSEKIEKLDDAPALALSEKNPFLMERDTAIELGGYPKESINIYVPSSKFWGLENGVYCIGNPDISAEKHISFGKIVLLKTDEIPDDKWYEFTQKELMTDSRIKIDDVMLRQSSTHYNINLRIGKKAVKNGFCLSSLGKTIQEAFLKIDGVKSAVVILIAGDSPLYKNLLEYAENIKEITIALNHIFDGIDMDCGHCNLVEICNEIKNARK